MRSLREKSRVSSKDIDYYYMERERYMNLLETLFLQENEDSRTFYFQFTMGDDDIRCLPLTLDSGISVFSPLSEADYVFLSTIDYLDVDGNIIVLWFRS